MARVDHWPELLADYIAAADKKPFVWGASDCLCFALRWHKIATGIDREAEHGAIRWRTKRAAYARLKRMGCANLSDLGRLIFGNEARPAQLGRGDIAVTQQDSFGIVIGTQVIAAGDGRLVALPLLDCKTGFRI